MFDKVLEVLQNFIKGPVASIIGGVVLLCQNGQMATAWPGLEQYCGIVAGVALLFAKFK